MNLLFWIYLINATILINHEIDSVDTYHQKYPLSFVFRLILCH
jgi:hypothetical protein